ncbi:MAG TPA: plastocyanin/azurin family copper-binding protein [Gemmatimonadales bacterium]|nr:plastocyanin/azurin family copper-binding protein [Gemmatimonadales bacterium]
MPKLRLFALAAFLVTVACSGDSTGSPPPPTLAVSVLDNSFSPSNGALLSGGTVTWTWNGVLNHDIVFEDGISNAAMKSSGTHQRTFPTVTSSTTFRYRCTLHSTGFTAGMVGQIVVSS